MKKSEEARRRVKEIGVRNATIKDLLAAIAGGARALYNYDLIMDWLKAAGLTAYINVLDFGDSEFDLIALFLSFDAFAMRDGDIWYLSLRCAVLCCAACLWFFFLICLLFNARPGTNCVVFQFPFAHMSCFFGYSAQTPGGLLSPQRSSFFGLKSLWPIS